jgi:hypothetical protein
VMYRKYVSVLEGTLEDVFRKGVSFFLFSHVADFNDLGKLETRKDETKFYINYENLLNVKKRNN